MSEALNEAASAWAKSTTEELKSEAKSLGIEHRANSPSKTSSIEALKSTVSKRFGVVSKIAFKFPRHMVFVHKGLGKGTPVSAAGSTNRKAKPWFEPVIDKNIDRLADAVAENTGDDLASRLNF